MAWMYTFDIGGTQTTYAMRNITYDFLTIYAGITGPPERWYYCTELVNIDLGFPLSRAYVDEFFPAGAKEEVSNVNFWKMQSVLKNWLSSFSFSDQLILVSFNDLLRVCNLSYRTDSFEVIDVPRS